jgi:hypothetical protein
MNLKEILKCDPPYISANCATRTRRVQGVLNESRRDSKSNVFQEKSLDSGLRRNDEKVENVTLDSGLRRND